MSNLKYRYYISYKNFPKYTSYNIILRQLLSCLFTNTTTTYVIIIFVIPVPGPNKLYLKVMYTLVLYNLDPVCFLLFFRCFVSNFLKMPGIGVKYVLKKQKNTNRV